MAIANPNTSGQGFDPDHSENSFHAPLIEAGWVYTHSTPIRAQDGSQYLHHTYRFNDKVSHCLADDWAIGVSVKPDCDVASCGSMSSGRRTTYRDNGPELGAFERYLKRKTRELKAMSR